MLLGIRGCGGRLLNDTYSFLQLYTWLIKSSQICICFGSHSDVTLTPHDGRWRYILNQWLRILRKASHWKLIQNSAPYTMVWRQCDINVFSIVAFKRKKFELYYLVQICCLLSMKIFENSKSKLGSSDELTVVFVGIEEKNKPMDELPNIAEWRSFFWFLSENQRGVVI